MLNRGEAGGEPDWVRAWRDWDEVSDPKHSLFSSQRQKCRKSLEAVGTVVQADS